VPGDWTVESFRTGLADGPVAAGESIVDERLDYDIQRELYGTLLEATNLLASIIECLSVMGKSYCMFVQGK